MAVRSIRLRLVLWSLAILAVVFLAFSAAVYFSLRRSLNEALSDSVADRSTLTANLISPDEAGRPSLDLASREDDVEIDDAFERLFDPSGAPLSASVGPFKPVELKRSALERALAGESTSYTAGSGAAQARVLVAPVRNKDGSVVGILQVGESTEDLRETLRSLLVIFAIAIPIGLLAATLGAGWLALRALSPIDDVTRAAREITASDLSRRLDLKLPDDEVGRLARTFDEMIGRLDEAFQRQRRFTADASHELRTPLTAIRGQIDVALERPRAVDEYRRVLATVNVEVERMTRLIGGLLMLARTDAGTLALQRERVHIPDLIESVATQVRPLATERGLSVTVDPGADATLHGDADLILQMLLNLADNAIKYTRSGAVTLGWRRLDNSVVLYVSDTGSGIPAEHVDRVFERFHRVDAARSRTDGGTGLGLAICKWIAEAHGGRIELESSPAGTTFTVTLPRA